MTTNVEVLKAPEVSEKKICSNCGKEEPENGFLEHAGKTLCGDCFEELTAVCDHCKGTFSRSAMTEADGGIYCGRCFDECFRFCSGCEAYIRSDRSYYSELHDRDFC